MAELGTVVALIKSMSGADPAVIEQAVQDWLDDHPEATTTVQDGSITEAKLAQDVLAELDEIDELKEAIETLDDAVQPEVVVSKNLNVTPYDSTYENKGVTFTTNADNSVSISGTPSGNNYWPDAKLEKYKWLLPAGTYTLSGGLDSKKTVNIYLYANKSDTSESASYTCSGNPTTFTTAQDYWADVTFIVQKTSTITDTETFFAQVEAGSTGTAYESPWASGAHTRLDDMLVKPPTNGIAGQNLIADGNGGLLWGNFNEMVSSDDVTVLESTSTSNKSMADGVIVNRTGSNYYVTNDIEINPFTWYKVTASADYGKSYYAILDSDHNVIDFLNSPTTTVNAIVNRMIYTPADAAYIRISWIEQYSGGIVAECNSLGVKTSDFIKWTNKFLSISYSEIDLAVINTAETYLSAGHLGFNACKGDVQMTYDGKLIMCHDDGFTFDGNGKIVSYNSENATDISDMTYAECMALEYAGKAGSSDVNHYQKVCDIDTYLDICKQYGMIAFITVRSESVVDVCEEVIDALKRHSMLTHAIINSYSTFALSVIRAMCDSMPLSYVLPTNNNVAMEVIESVASFGNIAITLVSTDSNMHSYIEGLSTKISRAYELNVGMMYAQANSMENITWLRSIGFCGAQIGAPVVPYLFDQFRFKIAVSSSTPSLESWIENDSVTATVSASSNVISVSDFTIAGSDRGFADLIMDVWMNKLPYRITATSEGGHSVTAVWQNNALKLTVADISVNDTIDIIIEV